MRGLQRFIGALFGAIVTGLVVAHMLVHVVLSVLGIPCP